MKDEIKNVSLSFCCQEDWDQFATIDEHARFCASCKHRVIDFTNTNQRELEKELQSGARVCGRFKASQMSDTFLKMAAASIVVAATVSSIACTNELAEIEPQPAPMEAVSEMEFMGDVMFTGFILEVENEIEVPSDSLIIELPEEE
jgi:hypothetical protein